MSSLLGFFFVYFVQNKPSNLLFISLMLWVEVNLGIFPYKRRNQINLFPIKIDGCFFFRSDEGPMLETSAFLPFTVANLRFQPSC